MSANSIVCMNKPIEESVEKQGVWLLAALYALGIVIVNFHLSEYKVAGQFGLFRPIYLFAGAYGILPVALGFVFSWSVASAVRKGHLWVKAVAVSVLVVAMWLFCTAACEAFNLYVAKDFPLKWDKWMWTLLMLALLLGGTAYLMRLGRWKGSEKSDFSARSLLVIPGVLLWLVYGYAFSVRFYNRIPSSWGGTRSAYVEFILDPNDRALRTEMELAGVTFYPGTTRTKGTKLILQTETDFVCAVKQNGQGQTTVSPFLLKRDTVQAIKYGAYGY